MEAADATVRDGHASVKLSITSQSPGGPVGLPAVYWAAGSGGTLATLEWYCSGEIVAVGEACDTMAAAMEGCGAVQRTADGADVVEADRWPA